MVRPSPHSRHRPKRQREPILGSDPSDGGDAGGGKSESPRVVPLPNEPDTAPPPDDTGAVEPDVPVPPPAPKRARTEEDGSNNDAKEGDADGTPHHLAPSEPSRASEAAPHLSVEELAGAVGSDNGGDGAAAVVLPSVLSASLPAWAAASAPPVEEEGMGLPRGANPLPHVTAASAATLPPLPSGGGLRENGAPTPTSSAVRDRLRRHGATAASDGGGGGATMSRPSRKAAQRNTTTGPDANADSDHDDHEDGEEGDGQPHLRVLKRRVAREDEALLRQQVQDEYAQFLHCDECLEENTDLKVSAQTAKFNRMFEDRFVDLLVFGKAYGHLHVPKLYQDNPPLGRWVVKIRAWKKRADPRLTESRKNRLDGVVRTRWTGSLRAWRGGCFDRHGRERTHSHTPTAFVLQIRQHIGTGLYLGPEESRRLLEGPRQQQKGRGAVGNELCRIERLQGGVRRLPRPQRVRFVNRLELVGLVVGYR